MNEEAPPHVRGFLLNRATAERHAELLARWREPEDATIPPLLPVLLPEGDEPLPDEDMASLRGAFLTPDMLPGHPGHRRLLGIVRRAPHVEWLHVGHAGTDAPIYGEIMDGGVLLTNSSGATSEPIAQTAIAGLLALHRDIPAWLDSQRRHAWERRSVPPPDLSTQTITVLGLGAIGGHIARLARAFNLHVIGVRRTERPGDQYADELVTPDRLAEVLPRTDWLAITVPLTQETHHLVDATVMSLMPQGARILNVARGAVIDEPAMIEALRSGHLGGAYLDVFEEEPLPEDSPLWDMEHVIISPHVSAASDLNMGRVDAIFEEQLNCWMRGEPLGRIVRDR